VIAIGPLTAILVMTAAVPAVAAGAKDDGGACDERSFAPDDATLQHCNTATLRVGRAIRTGRIRVLGAKAPIVPGQALLLGASRPGYVCALFASGLEARAGWVPLGRVATATISGSGAASCRLGRNMAAIRQQGCADPDWRPVKCER
jgi:hypothetical protein